MFSIRKEMTLMHFNLNTERHGAAELSMATSCENNDPDCTLMVNDFSVISDNRQTAIRQQVEELEAAGAQIDAIGVQGHFNSPPAAEVVLARLDNVARAGKPIWITEFDVTDPDPQRRAEGLENVYRAAFSHPAVEGILMWGFWDQVEYPLDKQQVV